MYVSNVSKDVSTTQQCQQSGGRSLNRPRNVVQLFQLDLDLVSSLWRLGAVLQMFSNAQGRRPLWITPDGIFSGTDCTKCAGPNEDWVQRGLRFFAGDADMPRYH